MKIIRNILIVFAILAIASNIASYFVVNLTLPDGMINKIGYLAGFNIPIIFGGVLLLISYFLNKAIQKKEGKKMVDSLFK